MSTLNICVYLCVLGPQQTPVTACWHPNSWRLPGEAAAQQPALRPATQPPLPPSIAGQCVCVCLCASVCGTFYCTPLLEVPPTRPLCSSYLSNRPSARRGCINLNSHSHHLWPLDGQIRSSYLAVVWLLQTVRHKEVYIYYKMPSKTISKESNENKHFLTQSSCYHLFCWSRSFTVVFCLSNPVLLAEMWYVSACMHARLVMYYSHSATPSSVVHTNLHRNFAVNIRHHESMAGQLAASVINGKHCHTSVEIS